MHPNKVDRAHLDRLEDLPNIGPALASDLKNLGFRKPEDLAGQDPFEMYEALCKKTGHRHDPCVLDVFMSVTSFMDGGQALPWWSFTPARKRLLSGG